MLIVLSLVWGSSFILMKKGMHTDEGIEIFSHSQVAALRMLFASLALLPVAIFSLRKIKRFKDLLLLAIVGFFGNFFPAYLFTYAETGISSGYTGMLNSFVPIFALIIGFVVFKTQLSKLQLIGVLIGTIGIVLLSVVGEGLSINGSWTHVGACILATLCYAISLNTMKYTLQHFGSFTITSLAFLIVLLPSVISNFNQNTLETIQLNEYSSEGLIYIGILSVVGTALAVVLFNKLISTSSVLFASSVTYLIPIVAVTIGVAYGESISAAQIGSMFVILIGVFVANYLPKLNLKAKRAK